jgi:hypothetical protein
LRGVVFVTLDKLANGCVIIPQFQAVSTSTGVCPERFDYLRCDSFCRGDFLCSGAAKDNTLNAVDARRCKSDVPIIFAGWRAIANRIYALCSEPV